MPCIVGVHFSTSRSLSLCSSLPRVAKVIWCTACTCAWSFLNAPRRSFTCSASWLCLGAHTFRLCQMVCGSCCFNSRAPRCLCCWTGHCCCSLRVALCCALLLLDLGLVPPSLLGALQLLLRWLLTLSFKAGMPWGQALPVTLLPLSCATFVTKSSAGAALQGSNTLCPCTAFRTVAILFCRCPSRTFGVPWCIKAMKILCLDRSLGMHSTWAKGRTE